MHNKKNYSTWRHCLMWTGASSEEKKLSKSEITTLFNEDSTAWMLRNVYDWDCEKQTNFWEIICDRIYDVQEYPSKTRNQIRRSLRDCDFRIVTKEELVQTNGYEVYVSAYQRYHDITVKPVSKESWEQSTLSDNYGEYWGVFEKTENRLIAFGKNFKRGNMVNYAILKAIPSEMNKHYPYFGLIYTMNLYYLSGGVKYVTDGFRSITEHSNIQPFLEKNLLFRKAYCKIDIHYRWWFKIAINMLYPFRRFIPTSSVLNVLKQESLRRGEF